MGLDPCFAGPRGSQSLGTARRDGYEPPRSPSLAAPKGARSQSLGTARRDGYEPPRSPSLAAPKGGAVSRLGRPGATDVSAK